MKRRSVTFFVVVVFLTWNVMTYFFVARGPQSKTDSDVIQRHLEQLESRIGEQVAEHERLLRELESVRENLQTQLFKQVPVNSHRWQRIRRQCDTWRLSPQLPTIDTEWLDELLTLPQAAQLTSYQEWLTPRSLSGGDLQTQLNYLEESIRQQIIANEHLLTDLQTYRKLLLRDPLDHLATGKGPGGVVVDDQGDGIVAQEIDANKVMLPVLVIACNRVSVRRNLDQLLKYRPSSERFPIVVSQDCGHGPTAEVIKSYAPHVKLIQHPDLSDISLPWPQRKFQGYYKIARHYKWALNQIFHKLKYDAVIVVEDDLDVSPDFFEYFAATYPILRSDPSLWCVSAWNDNGKSNMVADDPELLYRTDFFPGLGWMVGKKTWLELQDKWPKTFWDDWMRHPDQRKERACIRPEVSRTSTFGKQGVSKGQFYEKHLKFIKLNDKFVPFTQKDLSYLKKENYDESFVKTVYSAPLLTVNQVLSGSMSEHRVVRVQYSDKQAFKTQAKQLGIMDDLKSGVPRAGYRGVVSFMFNGRRVFFAPPPEWKGYDKSWN